MSNNKLYSLTNGIWDEHGESNGRFVNCYEIPVPYIEQFLVEYCYTKYINVCKQITPNLGQ